jgi:subtilisin family serine protease
MRVLIQLRSTRQLRAAFAADEHVPAAATAADALTPLGLVIDEGFDAVTLPTPRIGGEDRALLALGGPMEFSMRPDEVTQLVRGTIPEDEAQGAVLAEAMAHPAVVGVFADPVIEHCLTCVGDPAVGTSKDVARLLEVTKLRAAGMTGAGVHLAIVDTGINVAHLKSLGQPAKVNASKSWTPRGISSKPGKHPVDHGTMCAFDAGIAAPDATFLDHALLLSQTEGPTVMAGLLSDAIRSYAKLRDVLDGMSASRRALVISNSWGMFDPAWDFPPGHPGNYSDNPRHPFNVIVASLEAAGADILFAAGNCGRDCQDGRCRFARRPITGANSHGRVLSVAGVDTRRKRVGYSSQGPGRLSAQKPDIAAYTHFTGSKAFAPDPDSGTSAACPVLAGVVAAVRTKYPASKLSPASLRAFLAKTAVDLGGQGFDFDHGWGLVDTTGLLAALSAASTRAGGARRPAKPAKPAKRRATAGAGR